MIRRFAVKGFKSLADVDIQIGPLAVLFGVNAVGKSNLLDAMKLLRELVLNRSVNQAFEQIRGDVSEHFTDPRIAKMFTHEGISTMEFEVDVELGHEVTERIEEEIKRLREGMSTSGKKRHVTERFLRYRVKIELVRETGVLRIADECLMALNSDLKVKSRRKPFFSQETTGRGPVYVLRIEGQSHPLHMDVGLDHSILHDATYMPHHPHIAAFKEQVRRWAVFEFEPAHMRDGGGPREIKRLAEDGSNLIAYYWQLRKTNPAAFRSASLALRSLVPSADGFQVDQSDESGKITLTVFEGSAESSSRVISEGTLRILGLIALTQRSQQLATIGYEEPENGMPPSRLAAIAKLLRLCSNQHGRQFILITHSPTLPRQFKPGELYSVRKRNGLTSIHPLDIAPLEWHDRGNKIDSFLDEPEQVQRAIERGDFE